MQKTITRVFEANTPSGQTVWGEVAADYNIDPNYGADADGNRGIPRIFIDDIRLVYFCDKSLPRTDKQEATTAILEQAAKFNWTAEILYYDALY